MVKRDQGWGFLQAFGRDEEAQMFKTPAQGFLGGRGLFDPFGNTIVWHLFHPIVQAGRKRMAAMLMKAATDRTTIIMINPFGFSGFVSIFALF